MITYAESKAGYTNLWDRMVVTPTRAATAQALAKAIQNHRTRYLAIQNSTGVAWWFIGLLHMRESSFNFNTYLGNGQPLSMRTTIAPVGRGPFATFEAGAVDALKLEEWYGVQSWPVSYALWAAEVWNGQGYFSIGINSPYIWSWSNNYSSGKYVADGEYSSTEVDTQPGIAPVLYELIHLYPEVATASKEVQPVTQPALTPTPAATDPYEPIKAMLKAAGKLPTPTITITISGEATIVINGQTINLGATPNAS